MDLSRRQLLFVGAAAGGGFLVGWHRPSGPRILAAAAKATPAVFAPNAFIRVGRDGRITLIMNQVEMGQGTYTSMPMLLAEELEVGLDQVHLGQARPRGACWWRPRRRHGTSIPGRAGQTREWSRTLPLAASFATARSQTRRRRCRCRPRSRSRIPGTSS